MKRIVFLLTSLCALCAILSTVQSQDIDDNQTCLECHADSSLTGEIDGVEVSMFVNPELFQNSIHADLSCVFCHEDITEIPHEDVLQKVNCASCHEDPVVDMQFSVHKSENAPNCFSCHGEPHTILSSSNPASQTHRSNNVELCAQCHGENAPEDQKYISRHMSHPIETYQNSVHGTTFLAGNTEAANCSDCHGSHRILLGTSEGSSVNFYNVHNTCGKCHDEITETYLTSIHGQALEQGIRDTATCTSCHGEHRIFSPTDERSSVFRTNVSRDTCSSCHNSVKVAERYGLPYGQVASFNDSYHGLAVQFGSVTAANCASCHGYHGILPQSDPNSMVSPQRLPETCGQCHAGATAVFLSSPVHKTTPESTHWLVAFIRTFYQLIIPLTIGGMLLHNLIIYIYHIRLKVRYAKKHGERRFTTTDIIQHAVLAITFIALVITGFAIKFPSSWWVHMMASLGMTEELRGSIHRFMAMLFIFFSFYHLYYIVFQREGRYKLREITPDFKDISHAAQTVAHYTGQASEKPRRKGFYSYDEKIEYWALVWGSVVMIITGLILWFPFKTMAILPSWVVDLAEVVHYYEAWLATLAILVWHFFFSIFHPAEYPMNVAWLVGYNVHADHTPPAEETVKTEMEEDESPSGEPETS